MLRILDLPNNGPITAQYPRQRIYRNTVTIFVISYDQRLPCTACCHYTTHYYTALPQLPNQGTTGKDLTRNNPCPVEEKRDDQSITPNPRTDIYNDHNDDDARCCPGPIAPEDNKTEKVAKALYARNALRASLQSERDICEIRYIIRVHQLRSKTHVVQP